jgi:bacterial/archaeal transporter family protein
MPAWLFYSLFAILLYGIVGLFQKMATNHVSAYSSVVYCAVGYVLLLPWLFATGRPFIPSPFYFFIAALAGLTSHLGTWFLFASLQNGAKASVAIPLTALYPLLTILLARLFLAERLTALQWVGVILALIAGALMSYEKPGST